MNKEDIINYFLEKDILISPEFLEGGEENDCSLIYRLIEKKSLGKPFVLGKDFLLNINKDFFEFDSEQKIVNGVEINSSSNSKVMLVAEKEEKYNVNIVFSYEDNFKKRVVQDFVSYFRHRYESLKGILSCRQELLDSISIARLPRKQQSEIVSIIGLVLDKSETKNGNIKLTLEDNTGTFNVLITKNKAEVYEAGRDIVLDEVIGVSGTVGNNIIFCNNLYFPDISITHELKKTPDEVYTVFVSDIHFGIKQFLRGDFTNFVKWLNGEFGNQRQREIASKVGYLFVVGDVVEGVGIYPGQENDLDIKDIYEQYEDAAKFFRQIPKHIKIIICGGNHDAIRMSEPQPIFDKNISKPFYEIPNIIMVSNPAIVNIHSSGDFSGIDVLMYHGYSFIYYYDNLTSIISKGGQDRCDLIMKFLLQRRHLAPAHSSTLYVPEPNFDPLVIEKIPDIFVSGHIHRIMASNYRGVTLINSSCWVTQTEDQAKRGIVPHPAKIPIINLQTREVKIMNFLSEGENG